MPRHLLLAALGVLALAGTPRADVVINEVLPRPRADWSGNGCPSPVEDEWVELANAGAEARSLDDLFLADADTPASPRAGLAGTLAPGEVLFVTGEHAVDWQTAHGGTGGLALDDAGGTLALFRAGAGAPLRLDAVSWGPAQDDVSIGRWPDGSGAFVPFDALAGGAGLQPTPGGPNGGIATPKILEAGHEPSAPGSADPVRVRALAADSDGIAQCDLVLRLDDGPREALPMALANGTVQRGTWERVLPAQPAGRRVTYHVRVTDGTLVEETNDTTFVTASSGVVLNEILADPPPDLDGDANGDGVRHSADDEFVEILNHGATPVDVSAWSLADSVAVRHVFPDGLVLAPGELYVVFGGGTPTGIPARSTVASTGTLSLNNTADHVRLRDATGAARDQHAYGAEANADQSLIRLPDGDGPWTRPRDAGFAWSFSPGVENSSPAALEATSWARIKALYGP